MKDDAISRLAVLNLLSTMPPEEVITKSMLIQSVKQMAAAQPEKRTDKRTETHASDLISRQAAIDAARAELDGGTPYDIPGKIEQLPSAQPETAERTAETAQNVSDEDLISRKAAIDAVTEYLKLSSMSKTLGNMTSIQEILDELPSAQPERMRGKWIDDGDPFMWECGCCGYRVKRYNNTRYCPHCGAKMEVDDGAD